MKTKNRNWIFHLIVMGLVLILTNSCKKQKDQGQEQGQVPVLTTSAVVGITSTTAICGGDITSDGGITITSRGVCWSTGQNPTIADSKTTNGTESGSFLSAIRNLTANTKYYVAAYATNSTGTGYGSAFSFTTSPTVTDIAGNVYGTVIIGTQTWMTENLKTTMYRNGDLIGSTTPATLDISGQSTPKYQWAYDGNESNVTTYGRLYTWYSLTDTRIVCPTGWHVPSEAEWTTLTTFLGGADVAGGKLKETGTSHWITPNAGATNETGFTAVPSGYHNDDGRFMDIGYPGGWWSSTERSTVNAYALYVYFDSDDLFSGSYSKRGGYGVRCLKD